MPTQRFITVPSPQQSSLSRLPPLRPIPRNIGRLLGGLTIGLFLCSRIGYWLGHYYFFELFSHFQIQYIWAACGLMGLNLLYWLLYRNRANVGFPIPSFIVLLAVLFLSRTPWKPGDYAAGQPMPPGDVRVFHANVLYTRNDYETTISLLRKQQPNLYVLQEIPPERIRFVTSRLLSEFPYWFACWTKGPVWTLVGSRTPIQVDQKLARKWRIIALTTKIGGRAMSLVTVHPRTPLLLPWFRERNAQLALAAKTTRHNPAPTVLIGDFNISVFSPVYEDLFRPVEQTPDGQPVGKKQSLWAARQTLIQPTWPTFFPPMMIPIDHAFVNAGFRPVFFRTLNHPGSDHRAIVAGMNFSR